MQLTSIEGKYRCNHFKVKKNITLKVDLTFLNFSISRKDVKIADGSLCHFPCYKVL